MAIDFNINPLSDNLTKWSNTLKQFVGNLPTNCLNGFDHFVKLALKGLTQLFSEATLVLTKTKYQIEPDSFKRSVKY